MSHDAPSDFGGLIPGSRVGKYLIEAQIGRGGMAAVYRARDEELGRVVALKVLAPALAADEAFRQRFVRESRIAAAVDDPHIIPLHEAGQDGSVLFISMRYISGGDVRSRMHQQGSLTPEQAASAVSQVASALDAAHAAGLVHRDVKPANMLLDSAPGRPDHVYLSDFGLSKEAAGSIGLTGTGLFLGTVDYAAPEQIDGRGVDGRTDQYALGCAAFEMLTGAPPFRRDHGMAVLAAHLSQTPPQLSALRPELPPGLDTVFARVLAKSPDDRFRTCGEFAGALREVLGLGRYDSGSVPAAPAHPQTQLAWNNYGAPGPGPGLVSGSGPGLVSGPGSGPMPLGAGGAPAGAGAGHIIPGFGSQPSSPGSQYQNSPGPPYQNSPGSQYQNPYQYQATGPQYAVPPWTGTTPPQLEQRSNASPWAATTPPPLEQRSNASRWLIAAAVGTVAAAVAVTAIILLGQTGSSSSTSGTSAGSTPTVTITPSASSSPAPASPEASGSPVATSTPPAQSPAAVPPPANPPVTSSPQASPPASSPPVESLPAFSQISEPGEFTMNVPSSWTPTTGSTNQLAYKDPSTGFEIIVDWTPWTTTAIAHQKFVESELSSGNPNYSRISIDPAQYRDYDTADWTFTDVKNGVQIESIDQAFVVDSGASYAVELFGPVGDFQSVYDSDWQKMLNSFEPES